MIDLLKDLFKILIGAWVWLIIGIFAWVWLIIGIFALVMLNGGDPPVWLDKVMYEIGVEKNRVEDRPTDCDFFHEPAGFKSCHYERQRSSGRVWWRRVEN
jgi:hypothetical protein